MKQQSKVMILCAMACAAAKIAFGNSLFAFVAAIVSAFILYILVKTLFDVSRMPECTDQYREFVERLKGDETRKQK